MKIHYLIVKDAFVEDMLGLNTSFVLVNYLSVSDIKEMS